MNLPFPDLILIDGGKGQIDAVKDILENELGLDIPSQVWQRTKSIGHHN